MEPVEVVARFDDRGQVKPLSFVWQGHKYTVASSGRRWQDERGLHFLVMGPVERVFELIFVVEESRWYIKQADGRDRV